MRLPEEFIIKMKNLLGEVEFIEFLKSYELPRYYGLRVNTLKCDVDTFQKKSPYELENVPWTTDGFYYKEGENPGKHPYYHAGLYYIQEPSAMLPGSILGAKPGEVILDLCAAPGGKTVQIAAAMEGRGLLVSNDISNNRVKPLIKNIELCGIRNSVVTNETPQNLAKNFENFFDRILVDAPCSGEGMFRKDQDAAKSWENFKCERSSDMQREILSCVDKMLKPGGTLVYSTCTFSPEENERMIGEFMREHENYQLVDIPKMAGIEGGRNEFCEEKFNLSKKDLDRYDFSKAVRLWPHKIKGEGHFVAKLLKTGEKAMEIPLQIKGWSNEKPMEFKEFEEQNLTIRFVGSFYLKGNNLYFLPDRVPNLERLKVAKFGFYLGDISRDKFEPSHSMLLSLKKSEYKFTLDFASDSREIQSYLKGETLMIEGDKGLWAICVDGFTLGFAKQTGDILKNMYPKGWRKMS